MIELKFFFIHLRIETGVETRNHNGQKGSLSLINHMKNLLSKIQLVLSLSEGIHSSVRRGAIVA